MTSIDPWKEPGDPLLGDAMMLTTEYRRVSASLLERRLYIGSAQAAHIIDQLEMLEYLGPFDGSDSRQVL
jgi:recombination associated protein RdgC